MKYSERSWERVWPNSYEANHSCAFLPKIPSCVRYVYYRGTPQLSLDEGCDGLNVDVAAVPATPPRSAEPGHRDARRVFGTAPLERRAAAPSKFERQTAAGRYGRAPLAHGNVKTPHLAWITAFAATLRRSSPTTRRLNGNGGATRVEAYLKGH